MHWCLNKMVADDILEWPPYHNGLSEQYPPSISRIGQGLVAVEKSRLVFKRRNNCRYYTSPDIDHCKATTPALHCDVVLDSIIPSKCRALPFATQYWWYHIKTLLLLPEDQKALTAYLSHVVRQSQPLTILGMRPLLKSLMMIWYLLSNPCPYVAISGILQTCPAS